MNEKNLALFILEIEILLYGDNMFISDNLVEHINGFIYRYYNENKSLFHILYDNKELLEQFIEEGYEILPLDVVKSLIKTYYKDKETYANLVTEVGRETDIKIQQLVWMFINYVQELSNLYHRKSTGYQRILQ